MKKLNLNILKERLFQILIASRSAVSEMNLDATATNEIDRNTETTTDDFLDIKDQLDFQIAMIESLAG